ncbi:hypothetical protein BH20ACI2_BH20ACI2_17080 [soil metagenome]
MIRRKIMQRFLNFSLKAALIVFGAFAVTNVSGQDARLQFERLKGMETRARDVVEVNIDGKMLELAKRVTVKVKNDDSRKVGEAISGLKGIYVRVFRFENENEYNLAEVDELRSQLNAPGWERLANVRSKKNNQKIDVFTMFTGDVMSGVAVVISESKSVAVVNVIGQIDIDALVELSGRLNIPKIDIELDGNSSKKPGNEEE